MDDIAGGVRIEHGDTTVKATKNDDHEITLCIGDTSVTLNEFESGFLLAQMASWYETLRIPTCFVAGCRNPASMRVSVPGAGSGVVVCEQHGPGVISLWSEEV